jgi:hypothetical protein
VPLRVAALAILAGCPALSDADLQRRIDRDGDGAAAVAFGGTDCNDENAQVGPGAPELCDGIDNDCDGLLNAEDPDMPAEEVEWFLDADRDGVGRDDGSLRSCASLPGYVHAGGDCDDTDPEQMPGQIWYLDGDGDGFGLASRTREQCERPSAYALETGDCNDANREIHPGAVETCNHVDDDCGGGIDEEDPNVVGVLTWFPDGDGDTYGADGAGQPLCFPAPTDVLLGGDCDDTRAAVHPGAPDAWYDGVDADCLGNSDFDQDGDLEDAEESGGADCDDLRGWIHPGAAEVCDGIPNACDADTWTSSDEDGLAHFVPASGLAPTDHTAALSAGGIAAVVEDGTLYLCTGDWLGQVVVTGGTVAVAAAPGSAAVSLDAGAAGAVIDATGASTSLTVRDLTLTGGTGHSNGAAASSGGCLFADGLVAIDVEGTTIAGCSAGAGGGAWLHAASVLVTDALLDGNTASGDGGGLHVSGLVSMEGTDFLDNAAGGTGGGATAVPSAGSSFTDCVFDDDTAGLGGGLFVVAPGAPGLDLADCVFSDGVADQGGGVYQATGQITSTNTNFSRGTAVVAGGDYYLAGGALQLVGGGLVDGDAGEGGGLFAAGDATCAGTAFLRNAMDAVWLEGTGTFDAASCDLGAIPNDNTADVASAVGVHNYVGVVSVQCDKYDCTPP